MISAFFIDKITGSIEEVGTGERVETKVLPLTSADLKVVLKKNGWKFNWKTEFKCNDHHIYKLVIKNDILIQGLISLQPIEGFIEMHLIESAPHNYGRLKKYKGVSGNLVAFACKMSFDSGFEGFVGFNAKTRLMQHYIDTMGAELVFKNRMRIWGNSAKKLVNLYYKNYFDG